MTEEQAEARPVTRLVGDAVLVGSNFIDDGAIDIAADGRIVAVGPESDLGPTDAAVKRVGGLLMPGLVNAHAHTPMTLVRSAGDGLPLQQWLTDGVWPREGKMSSDDAEWGMRLGSAEMLLAGVTTTCEMYLHEDAVVSAVRAAGNRLVVTPGIIAALAPNGKLDGRIDEIVAFHAAHHAPADRVSVGFGPHSLYDLSPEQLTEVGDRARELDALVHIHLEETKTERDDVIGKWTGRSATELMADIGLLDGRVLGAHGVWLSDSDQRLLGEAGAAIAHCPVSNLKLGSGIAPVASMLANGITVGIGTDGVASNDDLDLWEELKLAPLLARGRDLDAQAMSAATALELGTVGAARAIGLDDVGLLEPGYHADIIRIDTDQPAFTPGIDADRLTSLVFAGSARFVTDVWVAGQPVVADRACLTVDVDEAMAEARTRGHRLL